MFCRSGCLYQSEREYKEAQLDDYVVRFNCEELIVQGSFFEEYIKTWGKTAPVNTSFDEVNRFFNYALSFTHFIPTNQEPARKCLQAITYASEQAKVLVDFIPVLVLDALKTIKEVHNDLVSNNIRGKVRQHIEKILEYFRMPLDKEEFDVELIFP